MPSCLDNNSILVLFDAPVTQITEQIVHGIETASRSLSKNFSHVFFCSRGIRGLMANEIYPLCCFSLESIRAREQNIESDVQPSLPCAVKIIQAKFKTVIVIGDSLQAKLAYNLSETDSIKDKKISVLYIPEEYSNALPETDHTPGYSSIALNFASYIAGEDFNNYSFFQGIKILITKEEETGWLAASTALARLSKVQIHSVIEAGPHLIYLPENDFSLSRFCQDTKEIYEKIGRATIVVSAGISLPPAFAAGVNSTASFGDSLAAQLKKLAWNNSELAPSIRAQALKNPFNFQQIKASNLDFSESFWLGTKAIKYAKTYQPGKMLALTRPPAEKYLCEVNLIDLYKVVNKIKFMPTQFINSSCNHVTSAYFKYMEPLLQKSVLHQNHRSGALKKPMFHSANLSL